MINPKDFDRMQIELDVLCSDHCDCGVKLTATDRMTRIRPHGHTHDCNYLKVVREQGVEIVEEKWD